MRRLGILLSGRGSNFDAIADSVDQNKIDAEIAVVISNNPKAPGLERAKARGLKQVCISSRAMERDEYDWLVVQQLQQENVELVCLAGYMRLLSSYFVNEYPERVLNIHPSLLPSFPGLEAQLQALENGVRYTGCTVHFVDEYMDSGPIIAQATVPVLDTDDEHSLAARILEQEHRIYTEAINLVLSGNYRIDGKRVLRIP